MSGPRVVKLGGSLIDYPGLVPAFRDWFLSQPLRATVLIAGGGPFVDAVRRLDRRHALEPNDVHWLCIRLLDATARLIHMLFPESEFCDRQEDLERRLRAVPPKLFAYSVEQFLQTRPRTPSGAPIPEDWSVTSDSIAAVLADRIGADELILLKSADAASHETLDDLARRGYVDEFLPHTLARATRLRCVNLRTGRERVFGRAR
ncbi:MAG: hypothetical protein FJ297_04815 [Planctomycetes bacterium]|nr:hypothetical protein [Planctomycetota bacterium]